MSDDVKIPYPRSLQEIVGSLLFASESPLSASELREAIRSVEQEEGESSEVAEVYRTCTAKEVEAALRGLEKAFEVADAGVQLVCTGGSYRLQTTPTCGRYVRALLKLDRPNRLGRASLETLAIIAYRQPLTKSEVEEIRGVDVSGNIKTLMDLQLIRLVGKSELPGHPFLYGTTPLFLEHFGLASLQQLNELDPTLQRSNPKKKAEQYKKPEKPAKEEKPEKEEAQEAPASPEAPESSEASDIPKDPDVTDVSETSENGDDFVIDDTPDEFDDDDDEDEFDEDEEDDDEDEDNEGSGSSGGSDEPDGM